MPRAEDFELPVVKFKWIGFGKKLGLCEQRRLKTSEQGNSMTLKMET